MMPVLWSFRCYRSADGTDEIRAWYDGGSKQLQARFLSRMRMLAQLPRAEWNENLYKNLHGPCSGLGEIRFLADKVEQRPLGFRSGSDEFTILLTRTARKDGLARARLHDRILAVEDEAIELEPHRGVRFQQPAAPKLLDELLQGLRSEGRLESLLHPLAHRLDWRRPVELPRDEVLDLPDAEEALRAGLLDDEDHPLAGLLPAEDQVTA